MAVADRLTQAPAPVAKAALRIAGLSGTFTPETAGEIPGLWKRLGPMLPLPGQADGTTYGVGAGSPGNLHYMAGAALDDGAPVPDGLDVIDLPARAYLVFSLETEAGDLHPQMQAATKEIWGVRVPASGLSPAMAPELEVYPPDFEPGEAGLRLEWWIPV